MTEAPDPDKLARAYRAVFGQNGKRTEAQKIVLADIEWQGMIWRNCFYPREEPGKTYRPVDPYDAAINEGKRIFAIRQIQMANSRPQEKPKKPKVKK